MVNKRIKCLISPVLGDFLKKEIRKLKKMDPENLLKGRMGEVLVEEMLKQAGHKVYRFGYEAVIQNLSQLEKRFNRESEVGLKIRALPDFLVVTKTGEPIFIEVKVRLNFNVFQSDLLFFDLMDKFLKPKLIIITNKEPYFRISYPPYINKEREITWVSLEKDEDLKIPIKILKEMDKLVEKYF
ncbi:hypothetical protein KAU40_00390 [Candidatus Parcubacteria bacterium]|nr:hypothetical protein [Candidatus Parcubacteria bacterium]